MVEEEQLVIQAPPKVLKKKFEAIREELSREDPVATEQLFQTVENKTALVLAPESYALDKPLESLPVLKAFRDFLDAERRRHRKRMVALTVVMAFLLLAVGGAGFYVGMIQLGNMQNDYSELARKIDGAAGDANAIKTDMATRLADMDAIKTRLAGQEDRIRATVDARLQKSVAQSEEVAKLCKMVEELETKNAGLLSNIDGLNAKWKELSRGIEMALLSDDPDPIPDVRVARPSARPDRLARKTSPCMKLSIVPEGMKRPVNWRLPLSTQE